MNPNQAARLKAEREARTSELRQVEALERIGDELFEIRVELMG